MKAMSALLHGALYAVVLSSLLGCAADRGITRHDAGQPPEPVATAPSERVSRSGSNATVMPPQADRTTRAADDIRPPDGSPVAIRAALGRLPTPQEGLLRAVLKVDYLAIADAAASRPPLNIAIVIDHSGSMAEQRKLAYALEASRWVVENMTERDVLSIIAFNDRVTVLAPAGRVVNKAFLLHRLEELSPSGYTDLSAGLLEGIAQIDSQQADEQVRQVLLLTDGLANRGVTDSASLRAISEKAFAKGISVSTFGIGTDFNERLLAEMASAGAGRYAYIRSAEQIPMAFKEEVRGLLQVVAQNAVVQITINNGNIVKVYGQGLEQPLRSYRVPIGNLRAAEQGFLLMEVATESAPDGEVSLTVDDPRAGGRVTQRVSLPSLAAPGGAEQSEDVLAYREIVGALERAELALRAFDAQGYRDARTAFDQTYARMHQRAVQSRDQELLNQTFVLRHFMDELAAIGQRGLLHDHRDARERL